MGGMVAQRALNLISNLVMTRILAPEAFGLMAIILTVHLMIEMMSDIGIRQSIVRAQRGEDPLFLNVAWTVQILRGVAIAAIVLLMALGLWAAGPAMAGSASVYADPQLPGLLAVSVLAVLFRGAESVGMYVDARKLQMKRLTMIEISAQLIVLVIIVAVAQIHPTVWVLVLGLVLAAGLRSGLSHLVFRQFKLRLRWDAEIVDELWRFGKWLIGGSMAGFFVNNGDRFILAYFLSAEMFGFYTIANLWLQAGIMFLTRLNDQVIYGGISEIVRTAPERVWAVLRKFRMVFDAVVGLASVCSIFGGAWLLGLLYTDEYALAGPMLALLGFRFITRRQMPLGSYLLAIGRSSALMTSAVVAAIGLGILVPAAFVMFGLEAAILAVALSPFLGAIVLAIEAKPTLPNLSLWREAGVMGAALIAAALYWVIWLPAT